METEELIEHILRRKHLEEMMNRPEKEHTPLEGMDNEQIKVSIRRNAPFTL